MKIGGFLRVLPFAPRYSWNIVESGFKHHNPNPDLYFELWPDGECCWKIEVEHKMNKMEISQQTSNFN